MQHLLDLVAHRWFVGFPVGHHAVGNLIENRIGEELVLGVLEHQGDIVRQVFYFPAPRRAAEQSQLA